jgi:hypothetical protein
MRAAIQAALPGALLHLMLVGAGPLIVLILAVALWGVPLVLVAIAGIVVFSVPQAIQRAERLHRARTSPDVVQALGPFRVAERRVLGHFPFPRSHRLEIGELDALTIGSAAFSTISSIGTHMHVPLDAEGKVPPHDAVFDLLGLATYSRTGDLLLELRRPDGELIYTDPAYAGEDADE